MSFCALPLWPSPLNYLLFNYTFFFQLFFLSLCLWNPLATYNKYNLAFSHQKNLKYCFFWKIQIEGQKEQPRSAQACRENAISLFTSQSQNLPWDTLSSHWHFQNGNTSDMKSPSHLKVLWFLSLGTDWRLRSWPAEAAFFVINARVGNN